eukprot:tig00021127_g18769.t1
MRAPEMRPSALALVFALGFLAAVALAEEPAADYAFLDAGDAPLPEESIEPEPATAASDLEDADRTESAVPPVQQESVDAKSKEAVPETRVEPPVFEPVVAKPVKKEAKAAPVEAPAKVNAPAKVEAPKEPSQPIRVEAQVKADAAAKPPAQAAVEPASASKAEAQSAPEPQAQPEARPAAEEAEPQRRHLQQSGGGGSSSSGGSAGKINPEDIRHTPAPAEIVRPGGYWHSVRHSRYAHTFGNN